MPIMIGVTHTDGVTEITATHNDVPLEFTVSHSDGVTSITPPLNYYWKLLMSHGYGIIIRLFCRRYFQSFMKLPAFSFHGFIKAFGGVNLHSFLAAIGGHRFPAYFVAAGGRFVHALVRAKGGIGFMAFLKSLGGARFTAFLQARWGKTFSAFLKSLGGKIIQAYLKSKGGKYTPAFTGAPNAFCLRNGLGRGVETKDGLKGVIPPTQSTTLWSIHYDGNQEISAGSCCAYGDYVYYGGCSGGSCWAEEYNTITGEKIRISLASAVEYSGGPDLSYIIDRKILAVPYGDTVWGNVAYIVNFATGSVTEDLSVTYNNELSPVSKKFIDGNIWLLCWEIGWSGGVIVHYKIWGGNWQTTSSIGVYGYFTVPCVINEDYSVLYTVYKSSDSKQSKAHAVVFDFASHTLSLTNEVSLTMPGNADVLTQASSYIVPDNWTGKCYFAVAGMWQWWFPPWGSFVYHVECDPDAGTCSIIYSEFFEDGTQQHSSSMFCSVDHAYFIKYDGTIIGMGGAAGGSIGGTLLFKNICSTLSEDKGPVYFYYNSSTDMLYAYPVETGPSWACSFGGSGNAAASLYHLGGSLLVKWFEHVQVGYDHSYTWKWILFT